MNRAIDRRFIADTLTMAGLCAGNIISMWLLAAILFAIGLKTAIVWPLVAVLALLNIYVTLRTLSAWQAGRNWAIEKTLWQIALMGIAAIGFGVIMPFYFLYLVIKAK